MVLVYLPTKLGDFVRANVVKYSIHGYYCNVNPGLINPKRLFNWEGTIYVPYCDYLEGTP